MTPTPERSAPQFATIGVVGVGLIGGSIAAAIKARRLAETVLGIGRDSNRLLAAHERGLIDGSRTDLARAAADCDLLVFCTPVDRIVAGVLEAAPACSPGALLTDAGSVKGAICRALEGKLPREVTFVGAHPIAGSEKQGFEHAEPSLFEQRVCVVTPTESTPGEANARVQQFWRSLGSDVREMSPEDHDRALGATSHLPHLVAASLALAFDPPQAHLAGSGFRDTTRIAGGDPAIWTPIFEANAAFVLEALARFERELGRLRQALERRDRNELSRLLETARRQREQALPPTTG